MVSNKNIDNTIYDYDRLSVKINIFPIEIIDDLADHMDRTDESLINKTQQVRTIHSKDRTCGYWVVIVILFIAIVAVALV